MNDQKAENRRDTIYRDTDLIRELKAGRTVIRPTVGDSMEPLLKENETLAVIGSLTSKPKVGDVVLAKRPDGSCVLHRIVYRTGDSVWIRGDNRDYDEKIPEEWIAGILLRVIRPGGQQQMVAPSGIFDRGEYLTGQYLTALVGAFLRSEIKGLQEFEEQDLKALSEVPEEVTPESLLDAAKRHDVGIVFAECLERLSLPLKRRLAELTDDGELPEDSPVLREKYRQEFYFMLTKACSEQVSGALAGAGVRFLPLKGQVTRSFYPRPDYRQMSDLDYLIPECSMDHAAEVLQRLGYVEKYSPVDHHRVFEGSNSLTVELHRTLFEATDFCFAYYEDIWQRVKLPDTEYGSGCCEMSNEDFYLYHVAHLAAHYYSTGCGIRQLIDLYLIRRALWETMDREYIDRELENLKLTEMHHFCVRFCSDYLETARPAEFLELHPRGYQEFCSTVWISETTGSREVELSRLYLRETEGGESKAGKVRYVLRRIFPTAKEMMFDYPILERWPVLAPFCWIIRIFTALFVKRDKLRKELAMLRKK